jgi:predicted transcriptional regulator
MPRRSKMQRIADKQRIMDMIIRGKPETEIAVVIGISQQAVSNEVRKIENEWRETRFDSLDMYKQKELQHLYFLFQEAINGWERSLKESEKKRQRVTKSGIGESATLPVQAQSEVTKEMRMGDPRFLQVAKSIREDIRSLLGIVKPAEESETANTIPKSPNEARKELAEILKANNISVPNELIRSQ